MAPMAASPIPLLSPLAIDKAERPNFEFLVVCDDKALFQVAAAAIRQVNGRLSCAPTTTTAQDFIARRRVDGILVDMSLPGALDLVVRVRTSTPNRSSVVFACMGSAPETQFAAHAGANFVLYPPMLPEKVAHVVGVPVPLMVAEKRCFCRYPLMAPVELRMKAREVESTMSNLSEGGMAIWSLYYRAPGSRVHFAFELPFGGLVRGQGDVAWSNSDGLAGIKFHILPDQAYKHLSGWINRRN